ncbi:hypothetical protein A6U88_33635 [Agrobacterium sp. B131/95]|nr:hypothetical protein A6U88_33635 [Agrobacterium sp. B131/95]
MHKDDPSLFEAERALPNATARLVTMHYRSGLCCGVSFHIALCCEGVRRLVDKQALEAEFQKRL